MYVVRARALFRRSWRSGLLGLAVVMLLLPYENGNAAVFANRTTAGVHGTIRFQGTVAGTIDLTIVSSADDTADGADAGAATAVTMTDDALQAGVTEDLVDFGSVTTTCEASTNGQCYIVGTGGAARYVATLTATLNFGGFGATNIGLRACRSVPGAGEWPDLRMNPVNEAGAGSDSLDWGVAGNGTALGAIDTGSCALNSTVLIAAGTTSPRTVEFQIAARVDTDSVSPLSSTVTFESF